MLSQHFGAATARICHRIFLAEKSHLAEHSLENAVYVICVFAICYTLQDCLNYGVSFTRVATRWQAYDCFVAHRQKFYHPLYMLC